MATSSGSEASRPMSPPSTSIPAREGLRAAPSKKPSIALTPTRGDACPGGGGGGGGGGRRSRKLRLLPPLCWAALVCRFASRSAATAEASLTASCAWVKARAALCVTCARWPSRHPTTWSCRQSPRKRFRFFPSARSTVSSAWPTPTTCPPRVAVPSPPCSAPSILGPSMLGPWCLVAQRIESAARSARRRSRALYSTFSASRSSPSADSARRSVCTTKSAHVSTFSRSFASVVVAGCEAAREVVTPSLSHAVCRLLSISKHSEGFWSRAGAPPPPPPRARGLRAPGDPEVGVSMEGLVAREQALAMECDLDGSARRSLTTKSWWWSIEPNTWRLLSATRCTASRAPVLLPCHGAAPRSEATEGRFSRTEQSALAMPHDRLSPPNREAALLPGPPADEGERPVGDRGDPATGEEAEEAEEGEAHELFMAGERSEEGEAELEGVLGEQTRAGLMDLKSLSLFGAPASWRVGAARARSVSTKRPRHRMASTCASATAQHKETRRSRHTSLSSSSLGLQGSAFSSSLALYT
mmetsp:Transcript_62884/g.141971  ORF Transcript_62884/g.141971 Transcript_62884/m.141971 type:complete len:528 (+) Transcript_62884:1381-2964(+)